MDKLGLEEATIVSFDIPSTDRNGRAIIHRLLHGRIDTKEVNGRTKTYRYPGLLDEGGFRMGQSVFLLPPDLASRLNARLRELKISHRFWDFWTDL
ncbi:MAG: hypothetical protein KAW09_05740 [Thermoplasmata archaeon]|nr:hypothetical protein [Thermoplasmata archaeon]